MSKKHEALLVGGLALALAILIYRPLLFPPPSQSLPWGSDTLGHVLKAAFLKAEIRRGQPYPLLFPFWYLGLDMLRYHPPLPYYLLVALSTLTGGDLIRAAHLLIVLSAWLGSWGGWFYHRWIGRRYAAALVVGLLLLPDNVRVALAEGNIPRTVAAAMLPWAVYLTLRSLEADTHPHHRRLLALVFALIVLSHAMMAAIYALGCGAIILLAILRERILPRRALAALMSVVLGLGLSAWWLLPSLSGGLAALSAKALAEAQPAFPLQHYFNPFVWRTNPESVYLGVALLTGSLIVLFVHRRRAPLTFLLPAWGMLLLTTPSLRPLFDALPLHHMLWPLRFLGLVSLLLWLAVIWPAAGSRTRFRRWQGIWVVLVLLEQTQALPLIHTRAPGTVWELADQMRHLPGWREATLDESHLGAEAAYVFTAIGGREQVFGWAFQGARNARYLALLNQAARLGATPYVVDRLERMGVDDVVLTTAFPQSQTLLARLLVQGYRLVRRQGDLALLHRDGQPRALVADDTRVVGIGSYALNAALLFPQMTVAETPYLDDFSLQDLAPYRVIYLDGFRWHRRQDAEALIEALARQGNRIVIETSHLPPHPVTHALHFLNVWGEQIVLDDTPQRAQWNARLLSLRPFAQTGRFWYAYVPQGDLQPVLTFGYLGETAILAGYRALGQGDIWFLGGNLVYHALSTNDGEAITFLENVLQVLASQDQPPTTVPLSHYQASSSGYRFQVDVARPVDLLLPITAQDAMLIQVDGQRTPFTVWEGMPKLHVAGGQHTFQITMRHSGVLYLAGELLSLLALLALGRWGRIWRGV